MEITAVIGNVKRHLFSFGINLNSKILFRVHGLVANLCGPVFVVVSRRTHLFGNPLIPIAVTRSVDKKRVSSVDLDAACTLIVRSKLHVIINGILVFVLKREAFALCDSAPHYENLFFLGTEIVTGYFMPYRCSVLGKYVIGIVVPRARIVVSPRGILEINGIEQISFLCLCIFLGRSFRRG